MRRPIKHYGETLVTRETGNAIKAITLIQGQTNADPYSSSGVFVNAGSSQVFSMEIDLDWAINNKTTVSGDVFDTVDYYIWFNIANQNTIQSPATLNQSDLKNQVFLKKGMYLGCSTALATSVGINGRATISHIVKFPGAYASFNKDDQVQLIYIWKDAAATHDLKASWRFIESEQA